jgi:hypothetical protein
MKRKPANENPLGRSTNVVEFAASRVTELMWGFIGLKRPLVSGKCVEFLIERRVKISLATSSTSLFSLRLAMFGTNNVR